MEMRVGLLGAGGQSAEAEDYLPSGTLLFRAVNLPSTSGSREPAKGVVDILTDDPSFTNTPVTAAVGAPGLRRRMVEQWGGRKYHTIFAQLSSVARTATVGSGSIISPGAVITAGAVLGEHVIVNVGASVSHSSIVGDFVTISPGVRIAGDCEVGDGVFLGIGAVVSHGVRVCAGATIGAGATVLHDIGDPGVYFGTPARLVRPTSEWLSRL